MRNENVRQIKLAFILFPLTGHREVESYNWLLRGQWSFYLLAFSQNLQPLCPSEAARESTAALEESLPLRGSQIYFYVHTSYL